MEIDTKTGKILTTFSEWKESKKWHVEEDKEQISNIKRNAQNKIQILKLKIQDVKEDERIQVVLVKRLIKKNLHPTKDDYDKECERTIAKLPKFRQMQTEFGRT